MNISYISSYSALNEEFNTENQDLKFTTRSRHVKDNQKIICAVFDGHGEDGKIVSSHVSRVLPPLLKETSFPVRKQAATKMFKQINAEILSKPFGIDSGAAAICFIIRGLKYQIINAGDCRAVLSRNGLPLQLSRDHRPSRTGERIRIMKHGGKIKEPNETVTDESDKSSACRIDGLSVSRGFGDKSSHPFITCQPDVFRYSIHAQDEFIIIGTDGIWDTLSNDVAVDFVRHYRMITGKKESGAAEALVRHAIDMGSCDNTTAVVIFFKR